MSTALARYAVELETEHRRRRRAPSAPTVSAHYADWLAVDRKLFVLC